MTELQSVQIVGERVQVGNTLLPNYIERGSVTVTPGGRYDCNRLTVTFIVGKVDISDPGQIAWDTLREKGLS